MIRIKSKPVLLALTALILMLCMPAGNVVAQEELTWPVEIPLMAKDWNVDDPSAWMQVGWVYMHNSRDDMTIEIVPQDRYRIKNVNIHVVQDPAVFADLLDKKSRKPKVSKFDYKTDYLGDQGILVDRHVEVIPFSDFPNVCWGMNEVSCPPFFAIVQAEMRQDDDGDDVWVDLPEDAYASNGGAFDRFDKEEQLAWAWYVNYPKAKALPGHFVDANVNGLAYATITQHGTTGEGGQFWYLRNERIGFSVGRLYLGDAVADRELSPPDLFGIFDLEDDRVLNMARLLQSLNANGQPGQGAINITEPVVACLDSTLDSIYPTTLPQPAVFFADDGAVSEVINDTVTACAGIADLTAVSKEEALENLNYGMQAGNIMKRNVSKTPELKSDKAKIEIAPVYVPARRADGDYTVVVYHDADGNVIETRSVAKPIVVTYIDEVEDTGAFDVFVSISNDDGDTWKRTNVSKTAKRSSLIAYPGNSEKPMLKVKDNLIFVAWTDKYCRGGRPGYAITVCPDTDGDGAADPCEVCRDTADGEICTLDYTGDDKYFQEDLFGVAGPQRSVIYDPVEEPGVGEVPYGCVWATRGVIDTATADVQWFKPERITSGRRDAYQLFAHAADDVAFGIVWQEDPKGLMPGEGDGPGDGWSGANTHSKTDIWYSYIGMDDFGLVDEDYPIGGFGDGDFVDTDPEVTNRAKALVPMSLPVKISDNDVCSYENIAALGGGEHDNDEEGQGTHRYCGTLEGIGTAEAPGSNPLCAYTVEKANPKGEIHNVCVTADGRLLDGNTGASRPNLFMQPYKKSDGTKGAYAVIGYEESKGVGSPPEDEEGCGDEAVDPEDVDHEDRYKPDVGKNVIYHSFEFSNPERVSGGGIVNLPETDEYGNPVYLVDEFGELLLDWQGEPQLAYENARRVRFLAQPKSKAGPSKTVLVALYRQGAEGSGKPADIFMRRLVAPSSGNPYAFKGFVADAQNLSSVKPEYTWQNPLDEDAPMKMLRWSWSPANLADSSAENPYTDARAHRGALSGDDLLIGYTWTPNWGRKANDKYDFFVRRSFNGGQSWTTDPDEEDVLTTHNVVVRLPVLDEYGYPVLDEVSGHVIWEEVIESTTYGPGAEEPPRNVSNLRNFRTSVLEPRLVKTPGTILDYVDENGDPIYVEDVQNTDVYQLAWGLEFNQNASPNDVTYPKQPLDIYYGRTLDNGQRFEGVIVTPQGGSGQAEEGSNLLARDHPEQGAAQIRQTPDGSRMYGIWLEEGEQGSDIMFRRIDYR